MRDKLKLTLFCVGLSGAIASSIILIYLLFLTMLGKRILVYEPNPIVALLEILALVLALGTCVVATEIYYQYLAIKRMIYTEKDES